jgi:hypothetical protein
MADHRLMKQLLSSESVTEEEVLELYEDLKNIYDNPVDSILEDAIVNRGCTYVESGVLAN